MHIEAVRTAVIILHVTLFNWSAYKLHTVSINTLGNKADDKVFAQISAN